MLIYNYKKEFLGIDEKDLRALGLKNLQDLQKEVNDFADLFVKTPGYIHNFKHVHWIDFITCAESNEESKVIINVNNKNYKAIVKISTTYLVDNPSAKAFIVQLNHLQELSVKESEQISGDIVEREAPLSMAQAPTIRTTDIKHDTETKVDSFDVDIKNPNITIDPYEAPLEINLEEEVEVEKEKEVQEEFTNIDFADDLMFDEKQDLVVPTEKTTQTVQENFDNGYIYDPSIAAEELGLPLDLIEEFIEDFIGQAKDFKDELYAALDISDLDKLKTLSHKLKGVAANLRIEDALEALSIANTSSDMNIIRENLNTLYMIVAKLANEEVNVEKEIEPITEDIETLDLEFKEDMYTDPIKIDDADVPEKIELVELADDTFEEDEPLDILDIKSFEEEIEEDIAEIALETYDKTQVANDIGLDIETFNELFEDYQTEAQEITALVQEAINNEEFVTCKNETLKLKSMSENMRINSFSEALETLTNSSDREELQDALDFTKTAIAAL